jgi:hypothetical protein
MYLPQAEADALIAMEKRRVNDERWDFALSGTSLRIPVRSLDGREDFYLDLSRARINIAKRKYQRRGRQVVVLARLDLGGPPHRNPDDEEIPCPHLHLYREGYGDKWAFTLPQDRFSNASDPSRLLDEFMRFCNITQPPLINRGLFP